MVVWDENGCAPASLTGTKFVDDQLRGGVVEDQLRGDVVESQRTHCVYPNNSRWDGQGDTKKAGSWACQLVSVLCSLLCGSFLSNTMSSTGRHRPKGFRRAFPPGARSCTDRKGRLQEQRAIA
jgi:hypothetical protein